MAVILFQVFDYDLIMSNDVIGVAVVACSEVPTIDPSTSSNLLSLSGKLTKTLPLFLPMETEAFKELQKRAGNKNILAQDFLKRMKKLM